MKNYLIELQKWAHVPKGAVYRGNSANQPYAWIKDAHVWSSALSDADMATVTT